MTRPVGGSLIVALLLLAAVPAHAQEAPAPPQPEFLLDLHVSNAEIRRNVSLLVTAGQVGNTAADAGLDRLFGRADSRGAAGVLRRIGQLWLVNVPLASLTHVLAHDSGHIGRIHEIGLKGSIEITDWPWPVPITASVETPSDASVLSPNARAQLALVGGGEHASRVVKEVAFERIFSRDRASYFDYLLLVHAQLDPVVYAAVDLRAGRFRNWESLFGGRSPLGDFGQFAVGMAYAEFEGTDRGVGLADVQRHASRLRKAGWLNLADPALWSAAVRVVQYAVTGQRTFRPLALPAGRLRLVPGAFASLSSDGPETGVDVWIIGDRVLPRVQLRWIDTPTHRRLWAAGGAMRARTPSAFTPEFRADVWQRERRRPGFRLEAGARGPVVLGGKRAEIALLAGYKSEGYLADAPRRAGALASAGIVVPF